MTPKDCQTTYLHLHNTEDESWKRARDLNRQEPGQLKAMMEILGLPRSQWEVDFVRPVGPTSMLAKRDGRQQYDEGETDLDGGLDTESTSK